MIKHIACSGCHVEYKLFNAERETTAILLHGFGVNRNMWAPQIAALSDYRVIAVDLRGHGGSRPCDSFSVIKAAEDVYRIAEAENCIRPLLVGLSMGGYVVQEYARLYPDHPGGCLIADATPIFIKYKTWEKLSLQYSAPLLKAYRWETLKKLMAKACATNEDARRQIRAMFDDMTKQEFITSWKGLTSCLHEADITFSVPLWFVYGEKDTTGTIRMHVDDWPVHYPGCEVRPIPGAAHVANMDAPEAFNRIMLEFIDRCR